MDHEQIRRDELEERELEKRLKARGFHGDDTEDDTDLDEEEQRKMNQHFGKWIWLVYHRIIYL